MAKKKDIFNMKVEYERGEIPCVECEKANPSEFPNLHSRLFFQSPDDGMPEIDQWVVAVISYTHRVIPIVDIRMVRFNGAYWDTRAGGNPIPTSRIMGWTNPMCYTL